MNSFFFSEIESLKIKENDEKMKLRSQLNQEKKLTEEVKSIQFLSFKCSCCKTYYFYYKAVKKLYQIVQEKKPKTGVMKNASETKRLEKEYKRLQMEVNKVFF